MNTELKQQLEETSQKMEWGLSKTAQRQLLTYVELLQKWNQVHNLTAIQSAEEILVKHLYDSLSLLPWLQSVQTVLDVGSGAGLPGLILAISRPEKQFTLLDASLKRVNFLQHVIRSLKLPGVVALHDRVEKYVPNLTFDWIISRAFSDLSTFVSLSEHLGGTNGVWVAMKANLTSQECQSIPQGFQIEATPKVRVPNLKAHRCLVFISRKAG